MPAAAGSRTTVPRRRDGIATRSATTPTSPPTATSRSANGSSAEVTPMSEQIMWAVKRRDGAIVAVGYSEEAAWAVAEGFDPKAEYRHTFGYHCIRVKVQEVGDA